MALSIAALRLACAWSVRRHGRGGVEHQLLQNVGNGRIAIGFSLGGIRCLVLGGGRAAALRHRYRHTHSGGCDFDRGNTDGTDGVDDARGIDSGLLEMPVAEFVLDEHILHFAAAVDAYLVNVLPILGFILRCTCFPKYPYSPQSTQYREPGSPSVH